MLICKCNVQQLSQVVPYHHIWLLDYSLNYRLLATLATRPLLARYSPATRSLLAVDLHVWFSQDEEVFTQQVK